MADDTNYGTDVELIHRGLKPNFPLVSGPKVVLYNLFRRVTTSPTLPAYRGNSIDLRDYLNEQLDVAKLGSIEKDIIRVCANEQRAQRVRAKVSYDSGEKKLIVEMFVTLREGTFKLIINLSTQDVTLEILDAANLG